jgi:hypothetical protein
VAAGPRRSGTGIERYRGAGRPGIPHQDSLADVLERVLDKGIVIAGDIQINLVDVELLTIKLRLIVASVDRAKEMGINWWETDPALTSGAPPPLSSSAPDLAQENRELKERLARLERQLEENTAPTSREENPAPTGREENPEPTGRERYRRELYREAQRQNIEGRSKMTKEELEDAVADHKERSGGG